MARAEACREMKIAVIDVHAEDLSALDDYLSRRLRELGVAII